MMRVSFLVLVHTLAALTLLASEARGQLLLAQRSLEFRGGSPALFQQLDFNHSATTVPLIPGITIVRKVVGTADVGKTFTFPAAGIPAGAIQRLTNGTPEWIHSLARGFPTGGGSGRAFPEATAYAYSHCGGPVDLEGAVIEEAVLRINAFSYQQTPSLPWTDYQLNVTVSIYGRCPPSFNTFGSGCAGRAGIPALKAPVGGPRLGSTYSLRLTNLPSTVFSVPFLLVGDSKAQWGSTSLPADLTGIGMPGCSLLVNPLVVHPLANGGGTAMWNVQVPNVHSLIGAKVYHQALVLDATANLLGVAVSNGGESTLGN